MSGRSGDPRSQQTAATDGRLNLVAETWRAAARDADVGG